MVHVLIQVFLALFLVQVVVGGDVSAIKIKPWGWGLSFQWGSVLRRWLKFSPNLTSFSLVLFPWEQGCLEHPWWGSQPRRIGWVRVWVKPWAYVEGNSPTYHTETYQVPHTQTYPCTHASYAQTHTQTYEEEEQQQARSPSCWGIEQWPKLSLKSNQMSMYVMDRI